MNYRLDIQILRAIAVLLVILFHLEIQYFDNGFLGVDIFFVISGYLIAQLYNKGTAISFYKRRLKRLFPAYIATLGITTFIVSIVAVPPDAMQQYDQLIFDFFGLSNIGFWLNNSYFASSTFKPLLNLWSLGVELQFYLIVPILFPLIHRYKFLLIGAIFSSLLIALYMTGISPKHSFFLLPFRTWEFLLGAFVAWGSFNNSLKERNLITSLLLVTTLFAMLLYPIENDSPSSINGHPGFPALLVCIITALILVRPLHNSFSNKNVVGRAFVVIGEYSYSIYLVHFPIIVLFNYYEFTGTNLGYKSLFDLLIIIILITISSILMFRYIESIRLKDDFTKRLLIISLISISLIPAGIIWNTLAYSKKQQKIFSAWQDKGVWRCGKTFRLLNPREHICPLSEVLEGKNVLLVGNSHADSIKDELTIAFKESNISTYFYLHNTPLQGSIVDAQTLMDDSKKLRIDTVIFHYSLTFYENQKYLEELQKSINLLHSANIKNLFIAPVPTYDYHIPKSLYRNTNENIKSTTKKLTADKYLQLNEVFFEFINDNKLSKNSYLTHTLLCPNDKCIVEENGHPLYYDMDHLTLTGARILRPIFDRIADDINNRERVDISP